MAEEKVKPKSKVHSFLTTVSVGVNIILAIVAGVTANKLNEAKAEGERLKNEILIRDNSPDLSSYYLLSTAKNLSKLVEGKAEFPFSPKTKYFRIFESSIFSTLAEQIEAAKIGNDTEWMFAFLVIVNNGPATAHSLSVVGKDNKAMNLGSMQVNSAVIIPLSYNKIDLPDIQSQYTFRQVNYQSKLNEISRNVSFDIPRPTTPSWTPFLGSIKGWGRASPGSDASHLESIIPE